MKPASYKRIFAYLIDILMIACIGVIIGGFIPVSEKYEAASVELTDTLTDYTEKKINEETYIKKVNDINYTLSKESIATSIITVVVYIGYFVILPYYWNSQTVGKKIMKIKIVSLDSDKKLTMNNYLIRALIIDSILSSIISIVLLLTLNKSNYILVDNYVSNFFMYFYIISFIMILFRKDGMSLHDFIARTRVVMVDDKGEVVKEADVVNEVKEEINETKEIEETKEEKEEVKKPSSKKKNTNKKTVKKEENKKTESKKTETKKRTN